MSSGRNGSVIVRGVIFVIELYRHMVSPMRLPSCRFTPTCSQYAVDALSEYGLIPGGWLAMVRLLKCGPWHRGGWDPIPERHGAAQHECEGVQAADHLWASPVQQGKSETRV